MALGRCLLATVEAILTFRNRAHGLLLSELGAFLLSPSRAPAGTKRLSNLLRSDKWSAALVCDWLWQQADRRLSHLESEGKPALLLWDESVLEKPESRQVERANLCPVRSSKAQRLARSRPGPPGKPTFVNGLHWVSLLLLGPSGPPTVAAMRWFSTRGNLQTDLRAVQATLLRRCAFCWGRRVLHVFDRGYAGGLWLSACLHESVRLVVRWPKRLKLLTGEGQEVPAWQVLRGQRSWGERIVWDAASGRFRRLGLLAALVSHPEMPEHPLWLVCARPGDGKEPWLLLTTEPVRDVDAALALVLAYARRWQVEMCFRYNKSELAMESPRLWSWQRREKLLLIVTLAYAYLLSLLAAELVTLRSWLLRQFCHRTGKRGRQTAAPLYRLRSALSRLWRDYPAGRDAPHCPEAGQWLQSSG
jgi:Transposase DDE domain.